jgi:hypothetical protein
MDDGFEFANGMDVNDDGSTNPDNGAHGDIDRDGTDNIDDAMPSDGAIGWKKTGGPRFVIIDLPTQPEDNLEFLDLSDKGSVLFTNTPTGEDPSYVLMDRNQHRHNIPLSDSSVTTHPLGYFSTTANALLGDQILGEQIIQGPTKSAFLWDAATNTYTSYPEAKFYYHDDILDDRNGFRVQKTGVPNSDTLQTNLGTLAGSGKNYARVERNGNVSSASGFWKYNLQPLGYGQRMAYPGTSNPTRYKGFNSAILTQPEVNPQPGQPLIEKTWTLFDAVGGLIVSLGNDAFVETAVTCKPGQTLIGVTSQGWLASDKEIWFDGRWHSLKEFIGNPPPPDATLLGLLDTGLAVARIRPAGAEADKLALLVPVEVRGYAIVDYEQSVGTLNGIYVKEIKQNRIMDASDSSPPSI